MELLNFLKQVPLPILILVILVLIIVTIVIAIQYMKAKGLDGIRADVYQLILKARGLLPKWLQVLIPENALKKVIQKWFIGVKDLLDDGKVNGSQENQNN